MVTIEKSLLSSLIEIADDYLLCLRDRRRMLLGEYVMIDDDDRKSDIKGVIEELNFHEKTDVREPRDEAAKIIEQSI